MAPPTGKRRDAPTLDSQQACRRRVELRPFSSTTAIGSSSPQRSSSIAGRASRAPNDVAPSIRQATGLTTIAPRVARMPAQSTTYSASGASDSYDLFEAVKEVFGTIVAREAQSAMQLFSRDLPVGCESADIRSLLSAAHTIHGPIMEYYSQSSEKLGMGEMLCYFGQIGTAVMMQRNLARQRISLARQQPTFDTTSDNDVLAMVGEAFGEGLERKMIMVLESAQCIFAGEVTQGRAVNMLGKRLSKVSEMLGDVMRELGRWEDAADQYGFATEFVDPGEVGALLEKMREVLKKADQI